MTTGHETEANGVRVSNARIYELLLETREAVRNVSQTVAESVAPRLTAHDEQLRHKADSVAVAKLSDRIDRLELRIYAIMSGLIAALLGAYGMGLI